MTDEAPVGGDRMVGGAYTALPEVIQDRLFSVLNALVAEVWTLRDRQHLVDAALAEHGIDVDGFFATWDGQPEALARRLADRDAFIERTYRSLSLTESDTGT